MSVRLLVVMVWVVWTCLAGTVQAAELDGTAAAPLRAMQSRVLTVGMVLAPPFIQKDNQGQLGGLSYDLWREVAQDLGLSWQVVEYDLAGLLAAVREGRVDVGVTDLSITPEREEVMDFSQPFYSTGLGIAVPSKSGGGVVPALIGRLLSLRVLVYAASLLGLLLVSGTIIWLIERRRNPQHFRPGRRGIGDGLWWSAVTMTAVGYGDTTPATPLGRTVALVWMFASVVLLAFFTAGITSSLTVESMGDRVRGPEDLCVVRTGVKRGASSEAAMRSAHVEAIPFTNVEDGLRALVAGQIDAFVHDQPELRYLQFRHFPGKVRVLSAIFDPQLYGFAFPAGSNLRKYINIVMLRRLEDREYRNRLFGGYLGKDMVY